MTTFVEVSEHNPVTDLERLVNNAGGKVDTGAGEGEDFSGYVAVVEQCLASKDEILLTDKPVFSTIFSLLFQMLQLLPSSTTANKFSNELGQILTLDPSRLPELKIELLSHLFNMLGDESYARPRVFSLLLQFAFESKNSHLLLGRLAPLERWVSLWKLPVDERANLFRWASRVSGQAGATDDEQRFRVHYLKTFDDPSVPLDTDATKQSIAACVSAIRDSDRCDHLLELRTIHALSQTSSKGKKAPPHAPLVALLRIVAVGFVQDFTAWEKENPKTLEAHDISREKLLAKLRTLTLCSFGRTQEVLTYDMLRDGLELDSDTAVERCVVASVRSGLLEARLDQLARNVTVTYTIQREFTEDSWRELKPQLSTWKENIRNVLVLLRHAGRQALEVQGGGQ